VTAAKGLPKQNEDFPAWYNQVVRQAALAENGPAKGSMIIKPYGFAIWENIQRELDNRFKATGHENVYFPLLIPMRIFEAEAEHVEGFAPEVAVVTHGGGEKLEEPLAIRPTSEAVIWNTYANWVQSYRDLPLLYNQWCNVLRWEMRTRLFLRTSEFLWQEGHTAHTTEEEAMKEALQMLEVYREVIEDVCAIPVLLGRKTEAERFAGAVETLTLEGMMRDRKALQCGTSHFLGQNFAKAYDVQFLNKAGEQEYVWGTSWGLSTRSVGAVIMTHGDDKGLRLPHTIAPIQVAIVPIYRSEEEIAPVLERATHVRDALVGNGVRVRLDDRDQHRPGFKFAEWELKGVPLRIEIGPRDVEQDQVVIADRVTGDKTPRSTADAIAGVHGMLETSWKALYDDAATFRDAHIYEYSDEKELREGIESEGGFWVGPPPSDRAAEEAIATTTKASVRVLRGLDGGLGLGSDELTATWGRAY
jgi:prolyl-tRNA synthetase